MGMKADSAVVKLAEGKILRKGVRAQMQPLGMLQGWEYLLEPRKIGRRWTLLTSCYHRQISARCLLTEDPGLPYTTHRLSLCEAPDDRH